MNTEQYQNQSMTLCLKDKLEELEKKLEEVFPLFRGGCGDCGRSGVCGLCGWALPPSPGHQEGTTKGGQTFNIFFHI